MALAAAMHHTAKPRANEEVEGETNDATATEASTVAEPLAKLGQHSGIGYELVLALDVPLCAADGGTVGGRFCTGFPRGGGADERSRSAGARAPPEGSREEEEKVEEETVAEVFLATSFFLHESFVLAVSCSVSWCCSVQQRIQSMHQFSEASVHVFVDSDPEVVPESGHSSTHPWYLAATGSVFALPGVFRKIGFSARRLQPVFPSPWYVAVTCSVSVQYLPRPRYTRKLEFSG